MKLTIMKKNILYTLCAIILIGGLNSCEDILVLEPAQSLSNETALDNDLGVKQTLVGAYDRMAQSSLLGGDVIMNADLYSGAGEFEWVGTYVDYREIFTHDILVNNGSVSSLWDDAYEVINTCNNVINAIDVVEAADQDRVRGEALTLRAWCYFELVRAFGYQYQPGVENTQLGVPLILTPTLNFGDNTNVTRNTVEECYGQIIGDLEQAATLLPEKNDVYVNTYTASALLARVYLQKEDYENARDAADRVIASNDYELMSNVADVFNQDDATDEDVFSVEISTTDGNNSLNNYYATNDFGGRGDIEIQDAHMALYDPLDARATLFFIDGGIRFTSKFNNEFGNISAIRIAEMYLIRAECNQRLGTSVGATPEDDYNAIHTRAGLPAAASVSLDDILYERHLELCFEGQAIHDIKRLHGMVGTLNYNDPKLIYPIPQTEIDRNALLVQNDGY